MFQSRFAKEMSEQMESERRIKAVEEIHKKVPQSAREGYRTTTNQGGNSLRDFSRSGSPPIHPPPRAGSSASKAVSSPTFLSGKVTPGGRTDFSKKNSVQAFDHVDETPASSNLAHK